jgi:hypothetical protein
MRSLMILYTPPYIAQVITSRMGWAWHVAIMEKWRVVYSFLVGKPEGKRTLRRPRYRWKDNNKRDPQEVGCGCVEWIELAQDSFSWRAILTAVMKLWFP